MVEGIIAGALAAIVSIIIALPTAYVVTPYVGALIPGFNVLQYCYTNFGQLLLYQLAFGLGVGVLSSFVAVRRYLRN
jgi:hypothetical protein